MTETTVERPPNVSDSSARTPGVGERGNARTEPKSVLSEQQFLLVSVT